MSRKALGRGLEALIPAAPPAVDVEKEITEPTSGVREVDLERIRPNPFQPRTQFDSGALDDLAKSIDQNGLLQPLVVRDVGDGSFELIAGERRLLASKQAGLERVPVVVRSATHREMLEIALVENLQREDLNAIEEAEAYQRLATEFGLTQEEIAARVAKSRSAVTNALRLLTLEDEFKEMVSRGTLSAGHARALLVVPSGEARQRLAREIAEKGLSVRQAESKSQVERPRKARAAAKKRSHPALEEWESRLRTHFGTQVRIVGGLARGKVEIQYFSGEDLERILDLTGAGSAL